MDDGELCAWLDGHGIPYERFDHAPVYTCEDVETAVPPEAGGVQTKNLFLRDKKGRRHWLLVTSCDRSVDLRSVAPLIGGDHLSLGSPARLQTHLGLPPGAVTVLGLVNDPGHLVEVVVDRQVWEAEAWRCHPLVNTATLVIPRDGIARVFQFTGHVARVVDLP